MSQQQETVSASIQLEPQHHVLFHYTLHPHQPRNVNLIHDAEKRQATLTSK